MYLVPIIVTYIYITNSIAWISKLQINHSEKLIYSIPPTIVGLIINLVLKIILIPMYGAFGAVFSTAISSLISTLVLYHYGSKLYPLNMKIKRLLRQFLVYLICLILVFLFMVWDTDIYIKILLKLSSIIIYIALVHKVFLPNFDLNKLSSLYGAKQ